MAAGIQPMTLGSAVSVPKKERGVTPRELRRSRGQDDIQRCPEGHVQREPIGGGTERPETEHPLARRADPKEGCAPLGHFEREREADDITVEGDRAGPSR